MPPFVMPPRGLWPCITINRSTDPEAARADRLLAWQVDEAGSVSGMGEQTATAVVGPVLRMCDNPECGGEGACDRIPDRPTLYFTATMRRKPGMTNADIAEDARWVISRTLAHCPAESVASPFADYDLASARFIPDGAEFTVHNGNQGPSRTRWPDRVVDYTAVYSGELPLDDLLAAAPPWDAEKAKAREDLMERAEGRRCSDETDACWP